MRLIGGGGKVNPRPCLSPTSSIESRAIPNLIATLNYEAELDTGDYSGAQREVNLQRASRALADRAVKKALEELAKSQGVGHLLPALNDKEENVRVNVLSVFNAPALYDSEEAFHGLMSALDDGTLFVRIRAAKALEGMKDARAEVGLRRYRQQVLSEIAKSYVSLINASEDGTQVGLIDALDVYGSKTMAEDFLNCGGEELKSAAIDWAARHRLIVTRGGAGGSSPRWHPH